MEPEDWDLSGEDFDSLERDAFQKIAQLRSLPTPTSSSANPPPPSRPQRVTNFFIFRSLITITIFPYFITELLSFQVDALPQVPARPLPTSLKSAINNANNAVEHSKEFTKASVKFFLHSSGNIAAKFQYDQVYSNLFFNYHIIIP